MIETTLDQINKFTTDITAGNCLRVPQEANVGNAWRKRGIKDECIDL